MRTMYILMLTKDAVDSVSVKFIYRPKHSDNCDRRTTVGQQSKINRACYKTFKRENYISHPLRINLFLLYW